MINLNISDLSVLHAIPEMEKSSVINIYNDGIYDDNGDDGVIADLCLSNRYWYTWNVRESVRGQNRMIQSSYFVKIK